MFTVYEIKNKVTNQSYIGMTSQSLPRRISYHVSNKKRNVGAHILAYGGLGNFLVSSLLVTKEKEVAEKVERAFICFRNSTNPLKGLNITSGGSSGYPCPEKVKQALTRKNTGNKYKVNLRKTLIVCSNGKTYESYHQAARELDLWPRAIQQACRGVLKTTGGLTFKEVAKENT